MKNWLTPSLVKALIISSVISCGKNSDETKDTENPKGDDAQGTAFRNEPAAGYIGNESWTFVGGIAEKHDGEFLTVRLYSEALANPCDFFRPRPRDGKYVAFTVPNSIGTTTFQTPQASVSIGHQRTQGSIDVKLARGVVEVSSIENGHVAGRLSVKADEENFVNGTFQIKLCEKVNPGNPSDPAPTQPPRPQIDVDLTTTWQLNKVVIFPLFEKLTFKSDLTIDTSAGIGTVASEIYRESAAFDLTATPRRLTRTITEVLKTDSDTIRVGTKFYCIYEIRTGDTPRKLSMACSETDYPNELSQNPNDLYLEQISTQ